MELIEKTQLPKRCLECQEYQEAKKQGFDEDAVCYNCDYALDRWAITIPNADSD